MRTHHAMLATIIATLAFGPDLSAVHQRGKNENDKEINNVRGGGKRCRFKLNL